MKTLCIDTSSPVCSVAILDNLNTIYECSTNDGLTHSQNLMPLVDKAFKQSNLSLADINLYSCCIGPGSFTGIRIGVATVKAFVDVYNKPSVGISSLEGLAYNISNEYVCSIIDAKHNNIYCQLFKNNGSLGYTPITEYISDNIDSCLLEISKYGNNTITFIGDGVSAYKDNILKVFGNYKFAEEKQNLQNAISIGKAAYFRFKNNLECPSLSPLYLKKSQAELVLDKNKK